MPYNDLSLSYWPTYLKTIQDICTKKYIQSLKNKKVYDRSLSNYLHHAKITLKYLHTHNGKHLLLIHQKDCLLILYSILKKKVEEKIARKVLTQHSHHYI